ncbi:MAG: MFS transporter [Nitrososphaerales archaeon]
MQYKWIVLVNTSIAVLMASIDTNIVTISLPTIGRELPHTSIFDLLWVLLGYQLVIASVLVNFGRLADMFGRIRLYKFGFAIFTIGSALCSISQTGSELVIFRIVQAIGSGFLISNSTAIITDAFPPQERGRSLGINQVAQTLGSVLGLALGGILTSLAGWQSIFWVNIPIGVFATLWAHYRLRELASIRTRQRIDFFGNITLAGGLLSILASISLFSLGDLAAEYFVLLMVTGVILIGLFIFVEKKVKYPMYNFSLFRIRAFTSGVGGSSLNSTARGAVYLVLSLYLQGPTMKLSPLLAGIFLIPTSASLAIWGPISGHLSDKYGTRTIATLGLIVSLAGFAFLTHLGPVTTFAGLLLPLVLIGTGFGMYYAPNRSSIMSAVPPGLRGVASGMQSTMVNTGGTLSQGIAFFVMSLYLPVSQIQQTLLIHSQATVLYVPALISSIHSIFYISAALLVIAIFPSALRGKNVYYGETSTSGSDIKTESSST